MLALQLVPLNHPLTDTNFALNVLFLNTPKNSFEYFEIAQSIAFSFTFKHSSPNRL